MLSLAVRRLLWHRPTRIALSARRSMATVTNSTRNAASGDAKRAEVTLKRFWKAADLGKTADGQYCVKLDGRPLKTPGGNVLELPQHKHMLARLIAYEWDNQEKLMKPHSLPLTSLASRAIDDMSKEAVRADVQAALLKYLDTDSICFHQDEPEALVNLQTELWEPILHWARQEFTIVIVTHRGLIGSQPEETKNTLARVLSELDMWQLTALERAVYASKSLLIGLALIRGGITAEQAAQAAHVEVSSQIQRWGEVEDSHDVDYQDIRRQLSSVVCLLSDI